MSRECFELLLRQLHHQIRFPTEEILGVVRRTSGIPSQRLQIGKSYLWISEIGSENRQ